jgi:sec-independent protein translocase protein TatC
MARVLRPIGHDDRLSIVDHLDELRSRLIVCGVALAVAFGLCFWQNGRLLHLLNHQVPATASTKSNHLNGLTSDTNKEARYLFQAATALQNLASSHTQSAQARAQFAAAASAIDHAARSLPQSNPQKLPVTLSPAEPFTTTLTVAFYGGLILSLPILIYQLYAFVVPALNRRERQVALPVMLMAPGLFVIGVVFAYLVVLGPAIHFLQTYNSNSFDILVQARPLYSFEILTMLGIGLAFEMPLALLGLDWLGMINARTLITHWRYALVIIAVIAAALPGPDLVTTALEMVPLVILYLLSIVMLTVADRRMAANVATELTSIDNLDVTG